MSRAPEIDRLLAAIAVLRGVDAEMPAQQIAVFLEVARAPGITMKSLRETLGISQSSTSRNVSALGQVHRKGAPGRGLIVADVDPMERRRKVLRLTAAGRIVAEALREAMSDE